jgi:hypothetical protein
VFIQPCASPYLIGPKSVFEAIQFEPAFEDRP